MTILGIVTVTNVRTSSLRDVALPAVAELLAPGVPGPLQAALGVVDTEIAEATAVQVTWWPGAFITVRYRTQLQGRIEGPHQLVATSGASIPPGAVLVESDGVAVGVWRVPHDPALPGLAAAMDQASASRLLADLGAGSSVVEAPLRAYRPGRRAVVEVVSPATSIFLKMVRPGEAESLHRIHDELAALLPVPPTLGFDPQLGVFAMMAISGTTLRRALDDSRSALPPPGAVISVLEHLPDPRSTAEVGSPIERLSKVTEVLSRLLPEAASRLEHLLGAVGSENMAPTIPVHGDFYETQLLVAEGSITGVVDVDTYGWGRPGDDAATMLAHLSVWQEGARYPERVRAYAGELLRLWDRSHDPSDLRRRVAAVVAALAIGPFRVQRPNWPEAARRRLALAERWVESAEGVGEGGLMTASS